MRPKKKLNLKPRLRKIAIGLDLGSQPLSSNPDILERFSGARPAHTMSVVADKPSEHVRWHFKLFEFFLIQPCGILQCGQ
jgi:hypothetical protein